MTAMRDWLHHDESDLRKLLSGTVLSRRSAKSFAELPEWDGALSGTNLLAELHRRLAAQGMTVLVLDFSPPAHPDVHVVKVVVPGLEVETMSYHRIGERGVRKLLQRGSSLVGFGNPPPGAQPVRLPAAAAERLGGTPWLDVIEIDRIVGALYPLYREPEVHCRTNRDGSGMRFAYNTNGTANHRLEDAIALIAGSGYDGIALTLDIHHLDPFADNFRSELRRISALLRAESLGCVIETGRTLFARSLSETRANLGDC